MKVILIVFISCISLFGFGQIQYDFDTLFYSYRISGDIDTVDIANSDIPTTFDGGQSILSTEGLIVYNIPSPWKGYQDAVVAGRCAIHCLDLGGVKCCIVVIYAWAGATTGSRSCEGGRPSDDYADGICGPSGRT